MKKHIPIFLLILVTVLYRVIPYRLPGFAPQIAMFLFLPSLLKSKNVSYIVAVLSLFISDLIYHLLYIFGLSSIPGFYNGQSLNYLILTLTPVITFFILRKLNSSFLIQSLVGATIFFILSNTSVWFFQYGFHIEKTLNTYISTLYAGIPFYLNSLIATIVFGGLICKHQVIYFFIKGKISKNRLIQPMTK